MAERVFVLRTDTMGVLAEGNQRRVMLIPANAVVRIVAGDLGGNGLLKVQYREKSLEIFASDLRDRGDAASEESA